jgi:hypothetical protein
MIIIQNTADLGMTLETAICISTAAVGTAAIVQGRIILNCIFKIQVAKV